MQFTTQFTTQRLDMTDQEQLDDLKTKMKALNAKARALKASIETTEKVLAADKESFKKLVGSYREDGEISYNRSQIEDLKRIIEDRKKPRVVWKEKSNRSSNYIVDKVTPKRISVKRVGATHCEKFNRDGTPVSSYNRDTIDLKATFRDDYNDQ